MLIPFVSIIIPVYNAQPTLDLCLESISKLDYPQDKFEVIVVDNGSTDAGMEIAEKYGVRILHEHSIQSSYAARNRGIKEARGALLAFTDADCIVSPGWLKNLVRDWPDESIGCFAGEIEAYQPITLVERFSDRIGILRQQGTLKCSYLPYTQTANSAYRREVFAKIGPFIPEMTSGGDGEFSWRMQKKLGLKIKFIPEALVYHKHRSSFLGLFRQSEKYETGQFLLKQYYPDYEAPTFETRRQQLSDAIDKAVSSFNDDCAKFVDGRIDLVDLASPFLVLLVRCGSYSAWTGKVTGEENQAADGLPDLKKFVAGMLEVITELEPTDMFAEPGKLGEQIRLLKEKNMSLVEELVRKERLLDEKEREFAEQRRKAEERENYIQSLLTSRSWKITAPLRKITGIFRGQNKG